MAGGWGYDWGLLWGRSSIDVQPSTQHSWVPRMSGGAPVVVDIRGGKTTANDIAPASAPGVVGFNALTMDEQFASVDAARWTVADTVVSGAVTFMPANATAGAGSTGASNGNSLKLSTKRVTVGATSFTGGMITSTAALDTPLYGFYMARVKIPHGQGVSPIWQMAAKNNAAMASVTVQYLHAVTPGRVGITYAHQSSAGVSAPAVTATMFLEAPTYTPGWHTLALSVEPVNGVDATGGVLLRAYVDGVKTWETTDTTATYWTANGGTGSDFWTTVWKGSQVDGQYVCGPDDALGVDDQRAACSISGTYPSACATQATDGRSIVRAGAAGATATLGTDATTVEVDYIRAWAFTAFSQSVTGSFTTTATWDWASSAVLGNTPGPDQYGGVNVTGLTADDNHNAGIRFRAGTVGDVLVAVTDRTWKIEITGGTNYSGAFTAGATSGKLDAEVTGPATGATVKIYWTPNAGSKTLIATQVVTMSAGIAAQTGVKLSIWQSDATVSLSGLAVTSTAVVDTTPGTVPTAPTLVGSAGNNQNLLSWGTIANATSYTLRTGSTVVATGTFTSYTHTGLTNGTAYPYTVTATNSAGTSAASNTVTLTPVAPPITTGWKSGVAMPGGASTIPAFATWRGEPVTMAGTWSDISFEAMVNLYQFDPGGEYDQWTGSIDLCCGAWWGGSWAAAAAGAYETQWRQFFQNARAKWHNKTRGTCYIRFAHEWNGNWAGEPWFLYNIADLASWRTAWHRFRVLQQQYFPESKLVCCTNGDGRTYGAGPIGGVASVLPNPEDYDVYASDIYEGHIVNNPNVFEEHYAIAQGAGKPFAIGEWGLHLAAGGDTHAATYLNAFNAFGRSGRLLYDVYFNINYNSPDVFSIYPTTSMPNGAALYRSLTWGA